METKTIDERALEWANNATIHKLSDSWYIHRNGYTKGATEQDPISRAEQLESDKKIIESVVKTLMNNGEISVSDGNLVIDSIFLEMLKAWRNRI